MPSAARFDTAGWVWPAGALVNTRSRLVTMPTVCASVPVPPGSRWRSNQMLPAENTPAPLGVV